MFYSSLRNNVATAAVIAGVASILACAESPIASAPSEVLANPVPGSVGSIAIDSFAVTEVEYPSAPGRYYYAPLIWIRAPAGSSGGDVVEIRLRVPGLGTIECRATRHVPAGAAIELFREVYGDFELTLHHFDGSRIPPAVATLEVFVREGGVTRELSATATVSPGSFPSSYTGGKVEDPWNCIGPFGNAASLVAR